MALAFEMGPTCKHSQEGQHPTTPGTPHALSFRSAFRIYNLDTEEKRRNGRVDGDFKFV